MEAKVLSEAKVYVGTYAKYNNGIYVSGLGERAGGLNRRKLDF